MRNARYVQHVLHVRIVWVRRPFDCARSHFSKITVFPLSLPILSSFVGFVGHWSPKGKFCFFSGGVFRLGNAGIYGIWQASFLPGHVTWLVFTRLSATDRFVRRYLALHYDRLWISGMLDCP